MATELSTGLATAMVRGEPFVDLMHNGVIDIYSGVQPATANMPPNGILLARITRDGAEWSPGGSAGGLQLEQNNNSVFKVPNHIWELKGVATGVAGWFRWRANPVGSIICIDGAIGEVGSSGDFQLFVSPREMTPETTTVITDWWFTVPPLGVPL